MPYFLSLKSTIFLVLSFTYFLSVYLLYKYRNKDFLSTDPIPKLFPLSDLKIHGDISAQYIYVKTSLYIENFSEFDINKNEFIMNAIIQFQFNRHTLSINDVEKFSFLKSTKIDKQLIDISVKGNDIIVRYNLQVTFSSVINHDLYPMNDHTISLVMTNMHLTTQEIIYENNEDAINISKNLNLENWNIYSTRIKSGYNQIIIDKESGGKKHSALLFIIKVKKSGLRQVAFLIMPILIVLFICTMSMMHFIGSRNNMSIAIGCITGILAYRYIIQRNAPVVSYYTLIEYVYNFCLIFIVLTFFFVAVRYNEGGLLASVHIGYFWVFSISGLSILLNTYLLYFYKGAKHKHTHKKNLDFKVEDIEFLRKLNIKSLKPFIFSESKFKIIRKLKNLFAPNKGKILLSALKVYSENLAKKNNIITADKANIAVFVNLSFNRKYLYQHILHLIKLDFLDNNLIIKSENDFIIFQENQLGNIEEFIDLLFIQLVLAIKNPQKILFIQDLNQLMSIWDNQLKLHENETYKKYTNSFNNIINNFFLQSPKDICFENESNEKIVFTVEKPDVILAKKFTYQGSQNINSACVYPLKDEYFQTTSNIIQTVSAPGVMIWHIQSENKSGAISFALINFNKNEPSYLNWYIKIATNYYEEKKFLLIEGSELAPNKKLAKIKKDNLVLASSMDVSRLSAPLSRHIIKGIYTNFIYTNNHGGINEKNIRMYILDDKSTPIMARQNIERFVKADMPIIFSPVGTNTLEAYADLIKNKKIFVLFPISGSSVCRSPEYENIVFFRPSMAKEAEVLLEHAINIKGSNRIAIFCQNDEYGLGALNGIKEKLEASNIDWAPFYYYPHNIAISKVVEDLKKFSPDSIFFFSSPFAGMQLIHEIGLALIGDINLFALSPASHRLNDFLNDMGIPLITTQLVPSLNSNLPIVQEYHKVRNAVGLPKYGGITPVTLEGFINATILCDILTSIGNNITAEAIIEKINSYKNVNFKGLKLNFNPETREIYNEVWLNSNIHP